MARKIREQKRLVENGSVEREKLCWLWNIRNWMGLNRVLSHSGQQPSMLPKEEKYL